MGTEPAPKFLGTFIISIFARGRPLEKKTSFSWVNEQQLQMFGVPTMTTGVRQAWFVSMAFFF